MNNTVNFGCLQIRNNNLINICLQIGNFEKGKNQISAHRNIVVRKQEIEERKNQREIWTWKLVHVSSNLIYAHSIVGSVCYYSIITVLTQLQQQLHPFIIFQAQNSFPIFWDFLGCEERNDDVRKQSVKLMCFIPSEFGLIGSQWIRKGIGWLM